MIGSHVNDTYGKPYSNQLTNLQKQQSDIANLPIKKIKYILQTINTKEDENRIVKKKDAINGKQNREMIDINLSTLIIKLREFTPVIRQRLPGCPCMPKKEIYLGRIFFFLWKVLLLVLKYDLKSVGVLTFS